jgi:hypothetical protein
VRSGQEQSGKSTSQPQCRHSLGAFCPLAPHRRHHWHFWSHCPTIGTFGPIAPPLYWHFWSHCPTIGTLRYGAITQARHTVVPPHNCTTSLRKPLHAHGTAHDCGSRLAQHTIRRNIWTLDLGGSRCLGTLLSLAPLCAGLIDAARPFTFAGTDQRWWTPTIGRDTTAEMARRLENFLLQVLVSGAHSTIAVSHSCVATQHDPPAAKW